VHSTNYGQKMTGDDQPVFGAVALRPKVWNLRQTWHK
jgi:hypothetical protein